jgi:Tol biopolymer transport system component
MMNRIAIRGTIRLGRKPGVSFCLLLAVFWIWCSNADAGVTISAPAWFPDGRRVIYQASDGSHSGLFVYDLASKRTLRLPLDVPGRPGLPSVSPDGSLVAFAVKAPETEEADPSGCLYLADANGGHPAKVPVNGCDNAEPVFSRDGRLLLFITERSIGSHPPKGQMQLFEHDLFAVELSTRRNWRLTNGHYFGISAPALDPKDGSVVIAMMGLAIGGGTPAPPRSSLFRMSWTGMGKPLSAIQPLHLNLAPVRDSFSNDSKAHPLDEGKMYYPSFDSKGRLYFIAPATGANAGQFDYDVYRWNAETNQTQRLTDLRGYVSEARPSPDGKWIALVQSDVRGTPPQAVNPRLCLVPVGGGHIRTIPLPAAFSGPADSK